VKRPEDLSTPRASTRAGIHYDPEAFGRFSEAIAGTLGTARFLVIQTVLVVIWITVNLLAVRWRWDPYPFILLNLCFSTQASYAAPLILLAQNRQAQRDRRQSELDRQTSARTLAESEYVARELAALSLAISRLPTESDLNREISRLQSELEELRARLPLAEPGVPPAASDG
jgi:uncharacterized membrane protein